MYYTLKVELTDCQLVVKRDILIIHILSINKLMLCYQTIKITVILSSLYHQKNKI